MAKTRERDVIDVDPRQKCVDAQADGLYNATPGCPGRVESNFYGGGGIKCNTCGGWFCF